MINIFILQQLFLAFEFINKHQKNLFIRLRKYYIQRTNFILSSNIT